MRSLVLLWVLLSAAGALAAGRTVLVTNCEAQSARDVNLIRVMPADARAMLATKSDISLASAVAGKIASTVLTLEVDINREGGVECFSLWSDQAEEKLTADDKQDLRGSVAAGLDEWAFRPYILQGRAAEVRASYRLRVEARKLVLEKTPIMGRPRY